VSLRLQQSLCFCVAQEECTDQSTPVNRKHAVIVYVLTRTRLDSVASSISVLIRATCLVVLDSRLLLDFEAYGETTLSKTISIFVSIVKVHSQGSQQGYDD
jgi:hypothetical protein